MRIGRWSAVLAAVLVLHGAFGTWFERQRATFVPAAGKPPVEVVLLQPRQIERAPAHPAPARAHARPAPNTDKPHRAAPAERMLQAAAPVAPPARPPATDTTPTSTPAASGTTAAAPGDSAPVGGNAKTADSKTDRPPSQGLKFLAPPSGNLPYDTFYNGVRNAPGTIHWASDGNGYAIVVSVPVPFVGTFTYESEGRIDAFGLSPDRYIEVRGRRGEDVTTFDRQARRIAFTRTPATLALPDGAQDRFSVVMQLASLVGGDPDAYTPGVTRNFYVADNDSGEVWPMETVGDETVRTRTGFIAARHFTRLPRHPGDARRIDVWLAPVLGWLPARIMQTEPNGTQVELVWGGPLAPPGAENAPLSTTQEKSPDAAPQPVHVAP